MSRILGPSGTPYVELGGERAWRQRVVGDIVVSYQWLDLKSWGDPGAEDEPEPCMCLFPAHRRLETGAYTIPQRNAWAYADSKTGKPTGALFTTAHRAAMTLGFDQNDKAAFFRILDIIVDGIPDLIDMPGTQPSALEIKKPVMGIEISASAAGKQLHGEVI
jgi:hypothetical protein